MFKQRIIKLTGKLQRDTAKAAIDNAPDNIEVVLREPVKARSLDANAMYWATLNDIAEQAWVNNRQYSADMWHEFFKQDKMVSELEEPYPFEHVKNPDSYRKFDYDIYGNQVCIASTTDLTKYGFSQYLEKVIAHGASLGVLFSERPR